MSVLPALRACAAPVKYLASARGLTSTHLAQKNRIPHSTTDYDAILADPDVGGVILCTRHHLHAEQVLAALRAGKHVLVEKPLCLSIDDLAAVAALAGGPAKVTVGFNRRFSPHICRIRELLGERPAPLSLIATVNAGMIPLKHWVHDVAVGGGRLVGEACHFIDLAVHLTGSPVAAVCAIGLGGGAAPGGDTASIIMRHANGANSVVNYFANGHRSHPKERLELYSQERVVVLDDFRRTTAAGFRHFTGMRTAQDKGHAAQFAEFAHRVRTGGAPLIPWPELANVARATLAIDVSIRTRGWVELPIDS
jgi:predicted dehydrogenase